MTSLNTRMDPHVLQIVMEILSTMTILSKTSYIQQLRMIVWQSVNIA